MAETRPALQESPLQHVNSSSSSESSGLALPAAVWVLLLFYPPRDGLTPQYVLAVSGLLVALALVDRAAPPASAALPAAPALAAWPSLALCAIVVPGFRAP